MHQPAIVEIHGKIVVADVLLDLPRSLVWAVCPRLPAPKLRVVDGATGEALKCTYNASKAGECPSAVLAYAYVGPPPATVLIAGREICLQERLEWISEFFSRPREVLVTTLFDTSDDVTLTTYKKTYKEVLFYENSAVAKYDETSIPWPLPYWSGEGIHCAQSTHLAHAALLCHIYAPHTWLFSFDLDEYVSSMFSLEQLVTFASSGQCDAVGLRSVWADAPGGVAAVHDAPDTIRTSPFTFEWPQRSKYGQQHLDVKTLHRGIHAPGWCMKTVLLEPREGRILHFAYASGAPRPSTLVLSLQ